MRTHHHLLTPVLLICLSFSSFRHLYMRIKKLSPTGENETLISQHTKISLNHGSHSQMPLQIRQITQQYTVYWQEIDAFTCKEEWCPSMTFQENSKKSGLLYDHHHFPMLTSDWNSLMQVIVKTKHNHKSNSTSGPAVFKLWHQFSSLQKQLHYSSQRVESQIPVAAELHRHRLDVAQWLTKQNIGDILLLWLVQMSHVFDSPPDFLKLY